MLYGIESIRVGDEITVELLLEIHRRLLAGTRLEPHGGSFRHLQNWIRRQRPQSVLGTSSSPLPTSWCQISWTTSARSATPTICPPLRRPRSHTRSSRQSTRSSTGTAAPAARSSTSSSVAEDSRRGSCHQCRSCSRRWLGTMSAGSRHPATSDRRAHPRPTSASTRGLPPSPVPAPARLPTQRRSSHGPLHLSANGESASGAYGPTRQPTVCCTGLRVPRCSQPRAPPR